jgi:hypothetical protein
MEKPLPPPLEGREAEAYSGPNAVAEHSGHWINFDRREAELPAAGRLIIAVHVAVGAGALASDLAPLGSAWSSTIGLEDRMDVLRPILAETAGIGRLGRGRGASDANEARRDGK